MDTRAERHTDRSSGPRAPDASLSADIAVIGGGLGAVAAALAAARAGRGVVLAAPLSRLGGQATTQLVPALDEYPQVESGGISATYRAFRDAIRAQYDGRANPGGGWVSRLCFEPVAAERAIDELLAPHIATGRLTVLRSLTPRAARRIGQRVETLTLAGPHGSVEIGADVFLDATDDGALLPLTGTSWIAGSEGSDAFGESLALPGAPQPEAVQSCTVGFVVDHRPDAGDRPGPAPQGYAGWKKAQPFTLEIAGWDDRAHRYRMFTEGPDGHPPFWSYRRLREGAVLGGDDIALINWAGNDYADRSCLADPAAAYRGAKRLSAAFLHWLRTECPRDGGTGTGYPGLRLRPDIAGTPDGYAQEAYLRESRRLRSAAPVCQQDLEPVPGAARAVNAPDSGGLASYHMDLHARVGHPTSAYAPTAPFQIPLSALVGEDTVNLLAAAKNLAATQVAASAYRVHHGEWAVGEAAGTLAAASVERSRLPGALLRDRRELTRLQLRLVRSGVPLAWLLDVAPEHPYGPQAHLLAAAGALAGPRGAELAVRPEDEASEVELRSMAAAAARLLGARRLPEAALPDAGASWGHAAARFGDLVLAGLDPGPPRATSTAQAATAAGATTPADKE
ncbi:MULTISPECIES: FAD-dependent oxidoreductase [unclassified Streptomyces]|uniref:FAD-dependent oxidoreductase n=1 Tax=unclassified Streptomyces TaxID=2593676 RepID=UPI0035D75B1B